MSTCVCWQADDGLTELELEDKAALHAKMGKWARAAVAAIHRTEFLLAIQISKRLRAPLDYMYHALMKTWCKGKDIANRARFIFYHDEVPGKQLKLKPDYFNKHKCLLFVLCLVISMHRPFLENYVNCNTASIGVICWSTWH